jgi:large subunit ribosomal protein L14
MIQTRSKLVLADNTGIHLMQVIRILGGSKRKFGRIGDVAVATVKQADPSSLYKGGQVVLALIVRTKKEKSRSDGSYIRFDDNAGVIIGKDKLPKGTRIFGPIAREIKDLGYKKIASMAQEIV